VSPLRLGNTNEGVVFKFFDAEDPVDLVVMGVWKECILEGAFLSKPALDVDVLPITAPRPPRSGVSAAW
jgi:hypothetical protein